VGFTLIELLVVIAIIAILAAILFPVFAQAREQARKASCQSNLKQLSLAVGMYRQDYDETYPFGGWRPNADGTWDWQNTVAPYIKNKGVYRCPSSQDLDENPANPREWAWNRNPVSYMYNNMLGWNRTPMVDAAVRAPADCVLLSDGHSDWGCANTSDCIGVDWMGRPKTVWLYEDTFFGRNAILLTGWGDHTWGLPRHQNGGDFAFADGHVKYYKFLRDDIKTRADYGTTAAGRRGLEGVLPWLKNGDPQQGGSWGTGADQKWDNGDGNNP